MLARSLNEHGLAEFNRYILSLRQGGTDAPPLWLLEDDSNSTKIDLELDVESPVFKSRYEMGVYVSSLLSGKNVQQYIGSPGFWSWFALLWFDQLCPAKADGSRKASMPYNYILSLDYKHRYRHAIYITWQLVDRYGEDALFLLCKELPVRGELIEQLMARQDILSLDGVMRLASELYTDKTTGQFKRGAASRKSGGCVSRLVIWLQQLERTHDLYSVSRDRLKDIIPSEFNRFLKV